MTYLTRDQVREVDRRAIEDYGVPGVVLMENAGRNATAIIRQDRTKFEPDTSTFIAIVCGRGNNGGDGFVIARHLSNAGNRVEIFLAAEASEVKGDALINFDIVRKMGIPIHAFVSKEEINAGVRRITQSIFVVDAILGTGFRGEVRAPLDEAIRQISRTDKWIYAIDVPSGLDCDSGVPSNATMRAKTTITFVAQKTGFRSEMAKPFLGEIRVADIGAPAEILDAVLSEATPS
ncbi:MAG: NAD(P)H-hydrate epimerase [Phycisphaerales bacterium]|nr:NAD(P)H-hydrate epimerase [Phycisphaerales bacterium]